MSGRAVASGLGLGRLPWAPGTWASLAAAAVGAALLAASPWALAGAALAATVGGTLAIRAATDEDDPGWVVIDEVAGQWIALLALPRPSWVGVVAGFLLFRVLDIAKPGPIRWADRRHGAAWVMADDVIAGALAATILLAVRLLRPGVLD